MSSIRNTSLAIGAALVLAIAAPGAAAFAKCINKGGQGTSGSIDGAKFQAWEIILQTTDFFGVWSPWMASSQKVGHAPGYKVSKMRHKCKKGGLGYECIIHARLCKK